MPEYISREAAISALRLVEVRESSFNFPAGMLSELKSIPAADVVEVRHGRWKFDDFDGDGWDYQCSECGGYSKGSYDYCYHCGAKMDRWKMDGGQDK